MKTTYPKNKARSAGAAPAKTRSPRAERLAIEGGEPAVREMLPPWPSFEEKAIRAVYQPPDIRRLNVCQRLESRRSVGVSGEDAKFIGVDARGAGITVAPARSSASRARVG